MVLKAVGSSVAFAVGLWLGTWIAFNLVFVVLLPLMVETPSDHAIGVGYLLYSSQPAIGIFSVCAALLLRSVQRRGFSIAAFYFACLFVAILVPPALTLFILYYQGLWEPPSSWMGP